VVGLSRSRLANLLVALASVAITLAAAEVAARWARSSGPGKEAGTLALYIEHDPVLGWRKRPGASAVYHRHEYTVQVRINRQGLRDPDRSPAPGSASFRVLALGDSFLEGFTVPLEETVTQVLERRLLQSGYPAEVLNAGTSGYSTDQEYLFYRNEGIRYSPHVVAVFFYYNDVVGNASPAYFGLPKPLLESRDGRLIIVNQPLPPLPSAPERAAPAEQEPGGSALFEWARSRMLSGAPRAYAALARAGLWAPILVTPPAPQLKVFRRRRSLELWEGWTHTAPILEALARETAANHSRLVLVYVPSRMEVSDRDWELTRLRHGLVEDEWDRGRVLARLRDISGKAGFPVLDLTPALRHADGTLGGPYLLRDGHWNALGHRVAGEELYRFLREQGWLPAGRR
jgi:lysophospholipase L1-like esterase